MQIYSPRADSAFLLVKNYCRADFSKMRPRPYPAFFIGLFSGLIGCISSVNAWTLRPIADRQYVPLSEVQSFYGFTFATVTPEAVRLVKPNKVLVAQVGKREVSLNNLRFYLSLPIVKESGVPWLSRLDLAKIIDPVLRPGHIRGGPVRTIVLDPGHGGNDQGTWSYYGTEKIYTLDVARRLTPLLQAQGLQVVSTRQEDVYVSLEERVSFANRYLQALFVSLHFNAGAAARGVESYVLTPSGVPSSDNQPQLIDFQQWPGNEFDSENAALATAIHGGIMQRIHLPDRGIRRARFHVLKGIRMPGILLEGGYLAGQDAFTISRPEYRQALAESISVGIARYLAAVPDQQKQMQLASEKAPVELSNSPPRSTLLQPPENIPDNHALQP